jgi:hypothetical protein
MAFIASLERIGGRRSPGEIRSRRTARLDSVVIEIRGMEEERLGPERYSRASRPHILNLEWIEDMSSPPNGKLLATSLATSAWNSSTAAPAHSPPALAMFAPLRTAPSQV